MRPAKCSESQISGARGNDAQGIRYQATIGDVLAEAARVHRPGLPMLQSTAALLATYFATVPEALPIDSVFRGVAGFRRYLSNLRYSASSICAHSLRVRSLISIAKRLDCNSDDLISPEWRPLLVAAKGSRCVDLVREMAVTFSKPEDVTHEAVAAWAQKRLEMGMSFGVTKVKRSAFWKLLRRLDLAKHAPPSLTRGEMYSTPMGALPEPLQSELKELLAWKLAHFHPNRPADAQIRPVTAKRLEMQVRAIHGFAYRIAKIPEISSLSLLLESAVVTEYVAWSLNERHRKGQYLRNNLSLLRSAIRQHPTLAGIDLGWLDPLLVSIPVERDSEVRRRKADRFLDYDKLAAVPELMHADRPAVLQEGQVALARHAMAELLIRWMTVLPWRQRNLRECRICGPAPNIFKGPVSPFSEIELPVWAQRELEMGTRAEFWQFRFSSDETKCGNEPEALLPRQLIAPLEEYLVHYRGVLVKRQESKTLFVNAQGGPLRLEALGAIVSEATAQYAGRRVTPHLFRDIVALAWLKAHPQDYLTLSKLLWHGSIQYTLDVYGARFNESSGCCAMEKWLDERAAGCERLSNTGRKRQHV